VSSEPRPMVPQERNRLVLQHMPLVHDRVNRAIRAWRCPELRDDLTQAGACGPRGDGTSGLMRAVVSWEPARGPFGPFAVRWIEAALGELLRTRGGMSRGDAWRLARVRRVAAVWEREHGRPPEVHELPLTPAARRDVGARLLREALAGPAMPLPEPSSGGEDHEIARIEARKQLRRVLQCELR
jgi:DNA-directed RNA polymerase specialized sigma subunit